MQILRVEVHSVISHTRSKLPLKAIPFKLSPLLPEAISVADMQHLQHCVWLLCEGLHVTFWSLTQEPCVFYQHPWNFSGRTCSCANSVKSQTLHSSWMPIDKHFKICHFADVMAFMCNIWTVEGVCACAHVLLFRSIKSIYKVSLSVHKNGNFWIIQKRNFQDMLCKDNANCSTSLPIYFLK